MTMTVLVSTWADGVFVCSQESRDHELAGQSVRSLIPDGRGGAFAIVNGNTLQQRRAGGDVWSTLATVESNISLSSCVLVGLVGGETIYVGTDDAQLLQLDIGATAALTPLRGFDAVPGREKWYAGQALVNGKMLGPPLGIRSITATASASRVALLPNVHVGGIPRSIDGGATWQPTIDIESDVHEVRAHPEQPEIVIAAAAVGLCISRDGGATWTIEREGLHAAYCSAVAFAGTESGMTDLLVAASDDHFASKGAIYRRSIDDDDATAPLVKVSGPGLPEWLDGIADTNCIATNATAIAIADRDGSVYVSSDRGWSRWAVGVPGPSSVLILSSVISAA